EYDTDLFDRETVERMAGHFTRLLESAMAQPDAPIGELSMLANDEREQLLLGWNDTVAPYASAQTLPGLFEAQVLRTPDAIAVVDEHEAVSYAELNARANRLGHYLRERGVGP
ncbi:AMP-binding protein, partial [Caballeronia sp. dw_276]|uniref:AMP-binding protein n=1 Tax=Caballeronia sp. dw_276 TaxID=2719795 RepID=UPI001BD1F7F5